MRSTAQDPRLRAELARRGLGYVLAAAKSHPVTTVIGTRPATQLAKRLPTRAWQRISPGPGAKGRRCYDWALIEVTDPAVTEGSGPDWLLVRLRISNGEYAFYRAHVPARRPWPSWYAWPDPGGESKRCSRAQAPASKSL
jgi:hypothetical protein